jgi:hypothetical protein
MLYPISKADQIKNETLLHRAKGVDFQRLLDLYGFHRLPFIPEQYVQAALRAVVYGAKGTVGTAFAFFRYLFQGWIDSATFSCDAVGYRALQLSEATSRFEGRWCEIDGVMHYIERVMDDRLIFSDISTASWKKVSFTTGQTYTIKVLPFWIAQDERGIFGIHVDSSLFSQPSTYLREDGEERENEPLGGILLDGQDSGNANPIYFASESITSIFEYAWEQILSAGIHGKMLSRTWTPEAVDEIFSSIYNANLGFFGDIIKVEPSRF